MKAATLTQILLWLAYPVIIFFGIHYLQPRYVAMLLALILIIRWRNEAKTILSGMSWIYLAVFSVLLSVIIVTTITNNEALLRLYPAIVNFGMLLIFGFSLKYPPSIIERFARLHEPELTASGVRYTRQVTKVWCGFFVLNGSIAIFTALHTSREVWSIYNGFVAYILMGTMFVAEWLVRRRFIAKNTKSS
jgi:uncharacterized membrane protein